MPTYRYYLSARVTDRPPPLESMPVVTADSPSQAAAQLVRDGQVVLAPSAQWIHFVSDVDDRGQPRGFQSIALAAIHRDENPNNRRPAT